MAPTDSPLFEPDDERVPPLQRSQMLMLFGGVLFTSGDEDRLTTVLANIDETNLNSGAVAAGYLFAVVECFKRHFSPEFVDRVLDTAIKVTKEQRAEESTQ